MAALRASTPAVSIIPVEELDCHLALAGRDLKTHLQTKIPDGCIP
jgi:hypothetical protein